MLMLVKQIKRTQETLGTRRGEHFFEPTSMCGANALIEKTMQRTKHILHMFCERTVINTKHMAAGGLELRSLVDSRNLPEQLRFLAQSRWRLTPLLSFCLWSLSTHISASRASGWLKHVRSAPSGTHEHRLVSQFRPICTCFFGPNVSPRCVQACLVCVRFLNFVYAVFAFMFVVCCCIVVWCSLRVCMFVVFVRSCAPFSICFVIVCFVCALLHVLLYLYVRARSLLYLFLYLYFRARPPLCWFLHVYVYARVSLNVCLYLWV